MNEILDKFVSFSNIRKPAITPQHLYITTTITISMINQNEATKMDVTTTRLGKIILEGKNAEQIKPYQECVDNFSHSMIYSETPHEDGTIGCLTCKICGNKYQWQEWGRMRSKSLTLAGKHLGIKHNMDMSSWFIFRQDWAEEQAKLLDREVSA